MSHVLIVNGSLGGNTGNTAELLALVEDSLARWANVASLELCREPTLDRILMESDRADAFVFGTGTYWDSWGSPLQRFFEMTAHTEGSPYWRGKPVALAVTAHAVGGKSVLSRLMGVLSSFGMLIPPFSALSYSWVNDVALPHAPEQLRSELWTLDDIEVICHNLRQATDGGREWKCWPTGSGGGTQKWLNVYSQPAPATALQPRD